MFVRKDRLCKRGHEVCVFGHRMKRVRGGVNLALLLYKEAVCYQAAKEELFTQIGRASCRERV